MARYTIFETMGEFDLEAITTFGMNAKPNSNNPIGFFGTGLKYALATLMRYGAAVTLYCNNDRYSFFVDQVDFRGKTFQKLAYRKDNAFLKLFGQHHELPYTTELGKNWELWMAFRELYSNTLDEEGVCYTADLDYDPEVNAGGRTIFLIDLPDFAEIANNYAEIFIGKDAERVVGVNSKNVEILPYASKFLYYKGMRAHDFPKEKRSLFTYSIKEQLELTEDRTIKSMYGVENAVQEAICQSTNTEMIEQILMAPDTFWEHDLDFRWSFGASEEFKAAVRKNRSSPGFNSSGLVYYSNYLAPAKKELITDAIWEKLVQALEKADNRVILNWPKRNKLSANTIHEIYREEVAKAMERSNAVSST